MNKSDLSVTNLAKKIVDNLINNSKELNLIINIIHFNIGIC